MARHFEDLTGRTIGSVTVLGYAGRSRFNHILWRCAFEGGTERVMRGDHIRAKCFLSCVFNFKRGHSSNSYGTYLSWVGMIQRCMNPNHDGWSRYGGAGIMIDLRWLGEHGFENFLADMGERPEGTNLSRRLDEGNYEPGNVEWGTPADQAAEARGKRAMLALRSFHANEYLESIFEVEWVQRLAA